jgi:iron complex outermembrane recepter protein
MRSTRVPIHAAALAAAALLTYPVLAQEAPAPAAAPAEAVAEPVPPAMRGIEEIIVTAERREQAAQDLGVSISAFSGDDLDSQNIQDIHDLQLKVPALVATGGLPQITLRGVGNDIVGPGVDPGFALHTNGIYATQLATALLDFYDVERIEVLPGPQGTLGGRNTTGGGIYIHTQRPTEIYEAKAEFETASYGKARGRLILNAPLGDTLGVRLVGAFESQGQPYDADGLDQKFGSNALGAGGSMRASVRWEPTEALTFDLIGSYARDGSQGGAVRYLGDYPAYPAGQSPLFGRSPDYTSASQNPDSARHLNQNRRQDQEYKVAWGQLIGEWDLGSVVAKSSTHYAFWDYAIDRDQDASDTDAERLVLVDTHKAWTQEITLQSDYDSRLQWLVGGNWQKDRAPDTRVPVWNYQQQAAAGNFVILDAVKLGLGDISPADICQGGSCFFSPLPADYSFVELNADTTTEVAGAFANLWLDVTDELRLIGGARFSYTRRDFRDHSRFDVFTEALDTPALVPFVPFLLFAYGININQLAILAPLRGDATLASGNTIRPDLEDDWTSVTGNIRAEYHPTDEVLLYGSFAAGERPGGFNFVEGWATENPGFDPETILAYEVGAKTTIADELQLNVAGYFYDYDNKFITQVVNNVANTENGKKAEIFGVEVQMLWAPTEALRLNANVGWLSAEYASRFLSEDDSLGPDNPTGFDPLGTPGNRHGNGPGGLARAAEDLDGNPLNRAPDWTVSLGAEYGFDVGANGRVTPRLDFSWRDEVYHRQYKNPLDRQEAYTKTDLAVRWDQELGAGLWAEAYVQNLEDRQKVKTNLESATTHRAWWLAAPRTFGVRIGYTWSGDELPF